MLFTVALFFYMLFLFSWSQAVPLFRRPAERHATKPQEESSVGKGVCV